MTLHFLTGEERPRELAAYAEVPVVNMLSPDHHPCQALADLMTRREALAPYRLDDALLAAPRRVRSRLHCLPAHPGEEITEEVLYGPRQRIWDQAENRRHAQKALLELLVGRVR